MTRHYIDTSVKYEGLSKNNSDQKPKKIENPQIEPVPQENQKLTMVEVAPEPYLTSPELKEVVNLAIVLGRPLLLQGDPGCGKTRLAYAVAYELGWPLEACYIKSTTRAQDLLYTYDAINRLYDSQLGDKAPKDETGQPRSQNIGNYIHLGPLGRAIVRATYGRRSVVLIDEIDKADLDFPNDLLLELDRFEFQVAECPEMHYTAPPDRRPIVFVTHNEEKTLPGAILRRCIFHYIKFPEDRDYLQEILRFHQVINRDLGRKAIDVLLRLRAYDLGKRPGLSELIDWVRYTEAVNTPIEELDTLPYIGALLKTQLDQSVGRKEFGESDVSANA